MICVGYHQMSCGLFNSGRSVNCQQNWQQPEWITSNGRGAQAGRFIPAP